MPNPIAQRYYPRLSEVMTADDLPEFLSFVESGLSAIFDRIHFKNLQYSKSYRGDSAFYSLDIVTRDRIDFPLPAGMKLVLNPDVDGDAGISSFPVTLEYQWEILAFLRSFNLAGFSYSIDDFYKLGLKVFRITDDQVISHTINFFVEPADEETSRYQQVLDDVNGFYGTNMSFGVGQEESVSSLMEIMAAASIPDSVSLAMFGVYIIDSEDFDKTKRNLRDFYKRIVPEGIEEYLKKLITPKVKAGFQLSAGIEFPRTMLKPVYDEVGANPFDPSDTPDPARAFDVIPGDSEDQPKVMLRFGEADFNIDTERGLGYQMDLSLSTNSHVQIGDTGFILFIDNMKLDLSKQNNIDEATLDGRPDDFIGAYIGDATITLPKSWNQDGNNSTGQLFAHNVLIGTGGLSGTIGMRATDPDPLNPDDKGLIQAKFGEGFMVSLAGFEMTFQQNAIISSDIHGTLQIPGFKDASTGEPAIIDINIHIGQDGEFNVVAAAEPALKRISVPQIFDFDIETAFFGREQGDDGRFYLGISGVLDIHPPGPLGQFLPDKLDINKMLIYDDGKFEFEGGKITLPKAYELDFGAAKISVTGIHSGSYEKDRRSYKYFGFDGGVKTNPSAVDAHGKGIKFYYSDDDGPLDWFIRMESLEVDIILPAGASPKDAAVMIHGFLSIAEPRIDETTMSPALVNTLKNSQEYAGGVTVDIPSFRGLKASAAMRLNPKLPSFIVDLGIEMSTPILLGTTGLGIYGFRALIGKKYVATKPAAGVPEDGEWWQYYKAKVDPDYREGVQISKMENKDGFSFGAGVSLATTADSGKAFSSKLFFLLSLPDVFLFQGQAQFLKERISLDTNPDPPFFAIIAISKTSIEAGFGVNYKLRENGKLVTVDGVIELGFFFGDSSAWYVNIGRETPEDRRIQARLFDILNMYFYLMMSSGGMRLGAGAKFEIAKKFGPLSAELKAYIDAFGKISRRPRQMGGAVNLGGTVGIKVCGFGFSVSGGATLAAEAPKPHIVTGEFEVCVKVLKKERCARFEFTWSFDDQLDRTRIPLIGGTTNDESNETDHEEARKVAKMTHMVTGESFPLAYKDMSGVPAIPEPDEWIADSNDDFRIPLGSYMDIEFKKSMMMGPEVVNKIGGLSLPSKYIEFVPPLRGKSDRVRHEFYLDNVEILYWDETDSLWRPYEFYNAMNPGNEWPANPVWGYWQQQQPGMNNKLRLLATTPLSYTAGTGNAYTIEDLGVNDKTLFCPGEQIPQTCVIFDNDMLYSVFEADTIRSHQQVAFRVTQANGTVLNQAFEGFDNGLFIEPGDTLEIFFSEPMKQTSLLLNTGSPQMDIYYYERRAEEPAYGLTNYSYGLKQHSIFTDPEFTSPIDYYPIEGSVDYIKITTEACPAPSLVCTPVINQNQILGDYTKFVDQLVKSHHLAAQSTQLFPANQALYQPFFGSSLYGEVPGHDDVVTVTQGHISPVSLSFTVTDNLGFSCLYTFEMVTPIENFNFASIVAVKGISVYTADDALGNNNNFMIFFDAIVNGSPQVVQCIGTTCKPLSYCHDSCSTALYKVCYLSLENYLLNQSVVNADNPIDISVIAATVNQTLQSIWRPNTAFAVRIKTADKLFREGSSTILDEYLSDVVYGFRTAGPIGHYHRYPVIGSGNVIEEDPRGDFAALDAKGKADEFRLTTLKSYIDYNYSYPNADGSLINAKPLFYHNAKLQLFYLYNYVYQFYNDWTDFDHSGSTLAESSLQIRIVDPAPSATPQDEGTESFSVLGALEGNSPSKIYSVNSDLNTLNNLIKNGNPCLPELDGLLKPLNMSSVKQLGLKPLKLYTAQFVARYNARLNGGFADEAFESVVHSYVFQTSRYRDLEEQVKSYLLKDKMGNILREAVYPLSIGTNIDYTLADKVMNKALTDTEDALTIQYADPFEQLVYGVLEVDVNKLQTAVTTEFNIVHSGSQIIGILIRNPEPFCNPKYTGEKVQTQRFDGTIPGPESEFRSISSKDSSQIFVTSASGFAIEPGQLIFSFRNMVYDGTEYIAEGSESASIDLTNYPI